MAFPGYDWRLRRRLSRLGDAVSEGQGSVRIGLRTRTVDEWARRIGAQLLDRAPLWDPKGPTHLLEMLGVSGTDLDPFQQEQVRVVARPVAALASAVLDRQREGEEGITAAARADIDLIRTPLPSKRTIGPLLQALHEANGKARLGMREYGIPVGAKHFVVGPTPRSEFVFNSPLDSPIVERPSMWTKLQRSLNGHAQALPPYVADSITYFYRRIAALPGPPFRPPHYSDYRDSRSRDTFSQDGYSPGLTRSALPVLLGLISERLHQPRGHVRAFASRETKGRLAGAVGAMALGAGAIGFLGAPALLVVPIGIVAHRGTQKLRERLQQRGAATEQRFDITSRSRAVEQDPARESRPQGLSDSRRAMHPGASSAIEPGPGATSADEPSANPRQNSFRGLPEVGM